MEGKEVKVFVVISLLMLIIFVEGSMAVEDYGSCLVDCIKDKVLDCIFNPATCIPTCAAKCAIQVPSPTSAAANYACNTGCTLSQCKNFMILNDGKKLGGCMASCSDENCAKHKTVAD
ncbi:uncharacterized protein LOC132621787 [Lycium barbarum]|uniref:uncharacterized protein LOC132621787 n=1 Tax=Lycium barbarum TaxID=112863 RepID=UPI00293EA0D8|nr:uncharacterized protein LOC132621787 [Lycium barbarum]